MRVVLVVPSTVVLLALGCNDAWGDDDNADDDVTTGDDDTGMDDDTADDDTTPGDDDTTIGDDDTTAADDDTATPDDDTTTVPVPGYMYAHTSSTLYEVDDSFPYTLTLVGNFTGGAAGQVTDLAIDMNGHMYAISWYDVYEVDPFTAVTTPITTIPGSDYVNAATVLANGTLLVGGGSQIMEVDPLTGAVSTWGTIPGWSFAGDMVGLPDGLLYCLMEEYIGATTALVVYDPVAGTSSNVGYTGYGAMYGIGFAHWTMVGFSDSGDILEIDWGNGAAAVVTSPGNAFWGATTNPLLWD